MYNDSSTAPDPHVDVFHLGFVVNAVSWNAQPGSLHMSTWNVLRQSPKRHNSARAKCLNISSAFTQRPRHPLQTPSSGCCTKIRSTTSWFDPTLLRLCSPFNGAQADTKPGLDQAGFRARLDQNLMVAQFPSRPVKCGTVKCTLWRWQIFAWSCKWGNCWW